MQTRTLITCLVAILLVSGVGSASAQMPPESVRLFAYSPATNRLAITIDVPSTIIKDRTASIAEVYDADSGNYLGFIPSQAIAFIYLQFNATGELLTTVTADGFVDTWDMSTFTLTEPSLPGGVDGRGPIAWTPHDDWLAASQGRQMYISSAYSPDFISFGDEATTSTLTDVGWSPDGNTFGNIHLRYPYRNPAHHDLGCQWQHEPD